jgi:hypothetical protein
MARKKQPSAKAAETPERETEAAMETQAPAADAKEDDAAQENRFRFWVQDVTNGYDRLTDEKAKMIVLKFHAKPSPEILAIVKEAGFRYQPEYFGQQKVWTRKNDFEGRELIDGIEAAVRGNFEAAAMSR